MNVRNSSSQHSLKHGGGSPRTAAEEAPGGSWRLPSGQSLAEFALDSGLVAPRLLEPNGSPAARRGRPQCSPVPPQEG